MYTNILVGYDGSEGSKLALVHALALARSLGASISALWVRGSLPHYPETVDEVEEEKDAAGAFMKKLSAEIQLYARDHDTKVHLDSRSGHPAKTILAYAEEGKFDLIVLGNRGHSEIWGRFLGHTADKISENAHCSVLIVRK